LARAEWREIDNDSAKRSESPKPVLPLNRLAGEDDSSSNARDFSPVRDGLSHNNSMQKRFNSSAPFKKSLLGSS
jgi:hypothetical protein